MMTQARSGSIHKNSNCLMLFGQQSPRILTSAGTALPGSPVHFLALAKATRMKTTVRSTKPTLYSKACFRNRAPAPALAAAHPLRLDLAPLQRFRPITSMR